MYMLPKKLGEKRGSHFVETFSSLSVSKKMESCHLLGQTAELQEGALKKLWLVGPPTKHSPQYFAARCWLRPSTLLVIFQAPMEFASASQI